MLFAYVYALLRLVVGIGFIRSTTEAQRDHELLALRHEVAILRRQVKRPDLFPIDRMILAAIGRDLPAGRLLFSPATLTRRHQELVRRKWAAFTQRAHRGRPPISDEVRDLILSMAKANPRWGERRIQGEMLKLGYRVSNSTIRSLLRRNRVGPAPRRGGLSWSQFLRAQSQAVLACDFFTVDSVLLDVIYVLIFVELETRRLIFSATTRHPDSAWVCQQARNVCMELHDLEVSLSVLVHDRDSKFTGDFDAVFKAEGARIAVTPYRTPQANGTAERLVKTIRTECLDFLIIFGERHLAGVLREFFDHYNHARPHCSRQLRPPHPAPIPSAGEIVRIDRLHGIVKEYSRAA